MAASVQARVKEIVCEQLGVSEEEVTPEASFIEDLGADSLDIVELVMALEEEYEMEISDEDAEKIKTVQDVITYIEAIVRNSGSRRALNGWLIARSVIEEFNADRRGVASMPRSCDFLYPKIALGQFAGEFMIALLVTMAE